MTDRVFVCASCKSLYELESAVSNCRICNETYCEECMNADGVCVPCGEVKGMEFVKDQAAA